MIGGKYIGYIKPEDVSKISAIKEIWESRSKAKKDTIHKRATTKLSDETKYQRYAVDVGKEVFGDYVSPEYEDKNTVVTKYDTKYGKSYDKWKEGMDASYVTQDTYSKAVEQKKDKLDELKYTLGAIGHKVLTGYNALTKALMMISGDRRLTAYIDGAKGDYLEGAPFNIFKKGFSDFIKAGIIGKGTEASVLALYYHLIGDHVNRDAIITKFNQEMESMIKPFIDTKYMGYITMSWDSDKMAIKIEAYCGLEFVYEVTIDYTNGTVDLTDYQVLLTVNNDHAFFNAFNNDHKYIEVYDSDMKTMLNFWVEVWDTTNKNARIWIKIPKIQARSKKKIYLRANTERTEPLSNAMNTLYIYDDLESGNINTNIWDILQRVGSVGIRTNVVYQGMYSLGIDQAPGQGLGAGVYDQNHTFLKLQDSATMGYAVTMYCRRWKTTTWYGHFAGFGMGGTLELYFIPYDNVWHKYDSYIRRINSSTVNVRILQDGSQVYNSNVTKTLGDILTYGIQTRHNGATDNSLYVRIDLVTVRKYIEPEPSVSYAKFRIP